MSIKFDVHTRYSGSVQFTAEINCDADAPLSIKLGLAVRWAISADANLADANLAGAYLAGAYLADANLAGAYLADANLAGAYLAGAYLADANLAGANLADANLAGAYLADANLAGANLADANLADANLAGAYLAGAYLADANLAGANLADANLADAKWAEGVFVTKPPLQVSGLRWPVTILDTHMQIGCQLHGLAEWQRFDDRAIADMDGRDALRFWRAHKDVLMGLARSIGREF